MPLYRKLQLILPSLVSSCSGHLKTEEWRSLIPTELQSKNIIFMILEPNCSVIAACLPCYRPLFASSREPTFLFQSFRSIFSFNLLSKVRSSDSKSSDLQNDGGKSQIELGQTLPVWSDPHTKGENTVEVRRYSDHLAEGRRYESPPGVQVTTKVDIWRD